MSREVLGRMQAKLDEGDEVDHVAFPYLAHLLGDFKQAVGISQG